MRRVSKDFGDVEITVATITLRGIPCIVERMRFRSGRERRRYRVDAPVLMPLGMDEREKRMLRDWHDPLTFRSGVEELARRINSLNR